jgi:hypothetical protein
MAPRDLRCSARVRPDSVSGGLAYQIHGHPQCAKIASRSVNWREDAPIRPGI